MKKYLETTDAKTETVLSKLLQQRQAPLSEEGMRLALADLTMYLSGDVTFYACAYPKKEYSSNLEIEASNIQKADLLIGDDEEYYYPVFTDTEKLRKWKAKLKKEEFIYACTKYDLLAFLQNNAKVAACVLNPGEDDLLLHRLLLQNMIAVYSQK